MKRKIYNIINVIFPILFIIAFASINKRNILIIVISLCLLAVFKKLENLLINLKNKTMFIFWVVAELSLLMFGKITNSLMLTNTSCLNVISLLVSLFIIFLIYKKNTNHMVTLFELLVTAIIFMSFMGNVNLPIIIFAITMPVASYLLSKFRSRKISKKMYSFINGILFGFLSLYVLFLTINSGIQINLLWFQLLVSVFSYYFYIRAMGIILRQPLNNVIINKNYLKKYIKAKKLRNVTAVIPNYNYAHYLHDRILSIVKQTYPVSELIILDDCSKDNSIEVIEKEMLWLKEEYPNISVKFIPNKTNSGNVFKQWQKAFEYSSGDYLWICEADDLCSKYFLNSVIKGFDDNKVVLSYAESKAINEYGKVFKKDLRDWIDIFATGHWNNDYIEDGNHELKYFLSTNNTIANASGVVFKKDKRIDFIKYLNKAQKYTLAGDWYFYSKVLLNNKISYVADSLNYHRIHSSSVTSTTDNFIHYKEIISIQNSISNDVKMPKDMQARIEQRNADLRRNFCISKDELYYDKIDLKKLLENKNINDEILLSIIIPVYNVEKYLQKCLKSVFKNLPLKTEVIIINDGSPDNSEEIIKEFASKYEEIVYIKKENGGLSSVKNVGLKKARGKYIIFLDSDDYVSSNMYDTMLKKIIDTDSDIVYSDVLMMFEDNTVRYVKMKNETHKDALMQILDNNLMAASWNKIVKRKLYDGLVFPEGLNNEDVAVSPQLFLRANKIEYIPSPFYKYVQRSGSIQNSGFNEKRFVIFDTANICFNAIKGYSYIEQEKVVGAIITHQILAILIYLIMPIKDKSLKRKYIEMFCEKFNDLNVDITTNHYVYEYLYYHKMEKLMEYIIKCDISAIERIK